MPAGASRHSTTPATGAKAPSVVDGSWRCRSAGSRSTLQRAPPLARSTSSARRCRHRCLDGGEAVHGAAYRRRRNVGQAVWSGDRQLLSLQDHAQPQRRILRSSRRTTRPARRPVLSGSAVREQQRPARSARATGLGTDRPLRSWCGAAATPHRVIRDGRRDLFAQPIGRARGGGRLALGYRQSNFPGTAGTDAYIGTAAARERRLHPDHPGPEHLRDGRPDHDGDARPGDPGHGRHVRPLGQGQPLGDRRRHRRLRRRHDRVPHQHQRRAPARRQLDAVRQPGDAVQPARMSSSSARPTRRPTRRDQVRHLQDPAPVCDRSDEFDGTAIDCALVASHPQRRYAHHGPARADGLRRPAAPADARPRDRCAAAATSFGPINFLGQDLASLGTTGRWRRSSPRSTGAAGRTSA